MTSFIYVCLNIFFPSILVFIVIFLGVLGFMKIKAKIIGKELHERLDEFDNDDLLKQEIEDALIDAGELRPKLDTSY